MVNTVDGYADGVKLGEPRARGFRPVAGTESGNSQDEWACGSFIDGITIMSHSNRLGSSKQRISVPWTALPLPP